MKTIAISLVALLVVSASCKKDSAGGGSNASQKLKTYTEDVLAVGGRSVETYDVNYDADGRLTSLVSVTKPGYRVEYTYQNNDRFTLEKIDGDNVTLHKTCYLNSNSLVDSTYQYNHLNDTVSFKYIYDEEKRLVKQKEYIHNYLISYPVLANQINYQYDLKGTLTRIQESFAETTYRYDSIHVNTVQIEPSYFPFLEKLPTHSYITRHGRTTEIEHTYQYDDRQRLIKERAVGSDGKVTVKTYTYQ